MKNVGKWLAFLLLLVLIYLGWRLWAGNEPAEQAERAVEPSMVLDRVWIDHIPEAATDTMHVFVALSDQPLGLIQKSSSYRLEVELFQFERDDTRIDILFPQTNRKQSAGFKVFTCDDLPPFDLCLEFSSGVGDGPKRYYGDSEAGLDAARALVMGVRNRAQRAVPSVDLPAP